MQTIAPRYIGGIWADGPNFETGHWLNGRLEGTPVDRLVSAILGDLGLPAADAMEIDGFVDGYVLERPMSARQALEPLAETFGFDMVMSSGRLAFKGRGGRIARGLSLDDLLFDQQARPYELRRAQETELPRELRLAFSDGDADYSRAAARSRRLAGAARRESATETAIVTRPAEAQRLADQRLQETWAGRETVELDLSPRCIDLEPGDVVSLPVDGNDRLFRLTRISDGVSRKASGRAVEPAIYRSAGARAPARTQRAAPALPGRPLIVPLALPIVRTQPPPLLAVAAFASPWPGSLAVWRADGGGLFEVVGMVDAPSIVGETLTILPAGPLWRTDRRAVVDVTLRGGVISSVSEEAALAGANALALLAADGQAEIVTVSRVELIGARQYRLSGLVRGIGGSEPAALRSLPVGSRIVVLDGAAANLTSDLADLGRSLRYRIGPAQRDVGDATMAEFTTQIGGGALAPLSPVRPRARRVAAGIDLRWIRRTRIDGDSWDIAEVPLGEDSERYEVRILSGETVLRAVTVVQPLWLYPAAEEIADFGAPQVEIAFTVAQVGAVTGRGQEWRGRAPVR